MAAPFAVDNTGMLLSIQDFGIAFDDSTFGENLISQIGSPVFMQHMSAYSGPITGGTASSGFGNGFSTTPSVWYGANEGAATLNSNSLTITSPPGSAPGPVNIKMLFPDGIEVFDPLFFSYGPFIEHAIFSGASPSGGAAGQILGFGLSSSTSGGSVTIGNSQVPIATSGLFGPFAESTIGFTIPAGSPGRADITVRTADGTSTAAKAMYYAQSVTDYPSTDTFAAILYDRNRSQLYLSAGDHVDVFSLVSNQFIAPLNPPAQGASKQFAGLALTPDGSLLLATDLLDGSLAVINPDSPATNYVIPIVAPSKNSSTCTVGPLYVAATIGNQAFITSGGLPGPGCGPGEGSFYAVDLISHQVVLASSLLGGCAVSPAFLASNGDGTKLAVSASESNSGSFCIYDLVQNAVSSTGGYQSGAAFSWNGNVAASQRVSIFHESRSVFTDSNAVVTGSMASPSIFYNGTPDPLLPSKLNETGSLYFIPYSSSAFFDIVDVRHGLLNMRFSLTETISNTADPMAIDPSGRYIYLLTNQGLSIVDLGSAPLSIGSLSQSSASVGNQITVYGSGFTPSTAAMVGGVAAPVSFVDQDTITLTIPSVNSGPADIVLKDSDGTTYTLENALTIL
jgi:hypothetical protein